MTMLPQNRNCAEPGGRRRGGSGLVRLLAVGHGLRGCWRRCWLAQAGAQEDQLNKVHVQPPASATPAAGAPKGAERPAETRARGAEDPPWLVYPDERGPGAGSGDGDRPDEPAGDGAGEGRFSGFREQQASRRFSSFASEDAPVSIGIIFDLSGSMTSKLVRARESILQFIKTANPQDEFFVIGFNDRPELIEDFTNSVEDIEARLATVRSGHRTALLDAIYYGVAKMKDARHERKALLVVSDGGDNRSRYTEGEVQVAGAGGGCGDLFDRHLRPVCAHAGGADGAATAGGHQRRDRRTAVPGGRYRRDGRHCGEDFNRAAEPVCDRLPADGPDPGRQVA